MKVCVSAVIIFMIFCFGITELQAQLINHKRKAERSQVSRRILISKAEKLPTSTLVTLKKENSDIEITNGEKSKETTVIVALNHSVTNQMERIYDTDDDGILVEKEIKEFLNDVVSSVDRRGKFKFRSGFLQNFDNDNDGKISRAEITSIKNLLN